MFLVAKVGAGGALQVGCSGSSQIQEFWQMDSMQAEPDPAASQLWESLGQTSNFCGSKAVHFRGGE